MSADRTEKERAGAADKTYGLSHRDLLARAIPLLTKAADALDQLLGDSDMIDCDDPPAITCREINAFLMRIATRVLQENPNEQE